MNANGKFIHKYYASFLSSNNNEDISSGSEYDSVKRRARLHLKTVLDLLLNKSNIFECQVSMLFFFLNDKKLSSHMAIHTQTTDRKSVVSSL